MATREFQTIAPPTPNNPGDIATKEYADGILATRYRIAPEAILDQVYPVGSIIISKNKPAIGEWQGAHSGASIALGSGAAFGTTTKGKLEKHIHSTLKYIFYTVTSADDHDAKVITSWSGFDQNGNSKEWWYSGDETWYGNTSLYTSLNDVNQTQKSYKNGAKFDTFTDSNYACSINFSNNNDEGIMIWKRVA